MLALTIIFIDINVGAVIELLIICSILNGNNKIIAVCPSFSSINYYHIKADPVAHRQCEIGVHEEYLITYIYYEKH